MIDIVVGGMYGSEAKGHVTQRLVERRLAEQPDVPLWNVRVGGPNAGHTGHDAEGDAVAFRQVPVGVLVPEPVNLEIAAGSEIDLPVLLAEIDLCRSRGYLEGKRLVVHGEATMIEDKHKVIESGDMLLGAGGHVMQTDFAADLVGKIGSTGKGIGAARADRMLRGALRLLDDVDAMSMLLARGVEIIKGDDGQWRDDAANIVIEGTQGYALGLRAGYYPQCTTSDCRAIDFLSMAGVSPWDPRYVDANFLDLNIWVVARVYPIRVAGNSGPMKGETSWAELGLPEERTTVTQKIRRVGNPDWDLLAKALRANGQGMRTTVALTMVDQMFPDVANLPWANHDSTWWPAEKYIRELEDRLHTTVEFVASGPNTGTFREEG